MSSRRRCRRGLYGDLEPAPAQAPRPLSPRCRAAYANGDHAVIGISPFNSYFGEQRIRALAGWGLRRFEALHLFVPDAPSAYTLMALGYAPEKARRKARRQANYLRNKILRALASLGLARPQARDLILDHEALAARSRYRELLEGFDSKFDDDEGFRRHCLDCSKWVLDRRIPAGVEPDPAALAMAARYFLAELPLFVDSVGVLEQSSSVFCYHRPNRFLEDLYGRRLSLQPAERQGFVVLPQSDAAIESA